MKPATMGGLPPLAECRVLVLLPFAFDAEATAAKAISNHNDAAWRQLLQQPGPAQAQWQAQAFEDASRPLSGDLYAVAARILCGHPQAEQGDTQVWQSIRTPSRGPAAESPQPGGWLAEVPLYQACGQQLFQWRWLDATVRLFGTGIGLLSASLQLQALGPSLHADDLLTLLHELSQPAGRDGQPLLLQQRFSWQQVSGPVKVGQLLMAHPTQAPLLRPAEPAQYERACRTAGSLLPLYRCVHVPEPASGSATPDAAAAPPGVAVWAETLQPCLLRAGTEDLVKQAALHVTAAQVADLSTLDNPPTAERLASRDAHRATHRSLHAARAGQTVWATRVPGSLHLLQGLLAFLPALPGLRPALALSPGGPDVAAAPAAADNAATALQAWRPFTYTAVRVDSDDPAQVANCRDLAFRLAHRFDATYRPDNAAIQRSTLQPFDTVCHAVASQGAALVVRNDGTEFLRHFVTHVFGTVYRPLAEICHHEYALLLLMVQQSAFLPRTEPDSQRQDKLQNLVNALADYRLYYRFSKISHLAHHNDVLALWRRGLGLDPLEADLAVDVAQAHRLLQQHLTDRQQQADDLRAWRWRWFTTLGVAAATFLSVSEGMGRWAESSCPPERLALALTDLQVYAGGVSLFDELPALQALAQGSDHASGVQQACARLDKDPGRMALYISPAPPAAAASGAGAAKDAEARQRRLEQVCDATRAARQCATRASDLRRRGLWASVIAAAVAAVLAGWFLPGAARRRSGGTP